MGSPSWAYAEGPGTRGHKKLPVRHQDETISGLVKFAYLELDSDGRPCFGGTGSYGSYRTEEYARCGVKGAHEVPDPNCTCGFWVPYESHGAISKPKGGVELEVEIGGRIIRGSAGVYRAQWQRVLSVTLPKKCSQGSHFGKNGCAGPARWLIVIKGGNYDRADRLQVACALHMRQARDAGKRVIPKPVSWLREELQTEIRPGDVSDTVPKTESDRVTAVDKVSLQQYSAEVMLEYIASILPASPREGEIFRVCIDATSKMQYEMQWTPRDKWQINAIYHPMLEPWGWGSPEQRGL